MASKPEANYIRSVNKFLTEGIDYQSMAGTYTNGVADSYYDGPLSDLWVEYKFVERLPRQLDLMSSSKPTLTPLQSRFLTKRFVNNHKTAVIVGCRDGGVIFTRPIDWLAVWERDDLRIIARAQVAEWIFSVVHGPTLRGVNAYVSRSSKNSRRTK